MPELGYGRADVGSMRRALDSGKKLFEQEYTLNSGAHLLRILPPKKDGPFFFEFMLHYLPGGAKVICPGTFEKRCPICDVGNKLFKSDDPQEVANGKKLYHRKAYLCNVIDCRTPKGVNVLRMGKNLVSDLIELFGDENDPEDEGCNFTDPGNDGSSIRIKVVMNEGQFPRYIPQLAKRGPVPLKGWLKSMFDLASLVEAKLKPIKELSAMVADVDFEENEDEDKPKASKKTRPIAEDEDPDPEDDNNEEEQDPEEDENQEEDPEDEPGEEEEDPEAESEDEPEEEEEPAENEPDPDSEEIEPEEESEEEEEPKPVVKKKTAAPPPPPPVAKKKVAK